MRNEKVLPSREVEYERLKKLYVDDGEDALIGLLVEAGDGEVLVHTDRGDVCVHIACNPYEGSRAPFFADALIQALLDHLDRERGIDIDAEDCTD